VNKHLYLCHPLVLSSPKSVRYFACPTVTPVAHKLRTCACVGRNLECWTAAQYSSISVYKQRCTPNVSLTPDVLQTNCKRRTGLDLIECNTQSVNNSVTDCRACITGGGGGVGDL